MKKLLIWGAGDQGTVTLHCALTMNVYEHIDFLDFIEKGHRDIPGYMIFEEKDVELLHFLKDYDEVIVASGDNELREKKIAQLEMMNIPIATIIHPMAVISPFVTIGKGTTILALASIQINASIGKGCIVNTGVIIEHDCIIQDFVNICPAVAMAGHVMIGHHTFMGIGSTVIDDVKIGHHVTIGAGATVICDIAEKSVAVGVPAKVIKKRS